MISDSTFQQVPVNLMIMNSAYYQKTPPKKVKYLVENWKEEVVGLITISFRDGIYYVVDGAARKAAAIELGIKNMDCQVYTDLTFGKEVELFQIIHMGYRKGYTESEVSNLEAPKIMEEIELLLNQFIRCSNDGVFDKENPHKNLCESCSCEREKILDLVVALNDIENL